MKKFLSEYPVLLSEWHTTKNSELKPEDFTHGSHKKIWQLCPNSHAHDSVIKSITRKDKPTISPYCSGRNIGEDNNLLSIFPTIADEWHTTKNGS